MTCLRAKTNRGKRYYFTVPRKTSDRLAKFLFNLHFQPTVTLKVKATKIQAVAKGQAVGKPLTTIHLKSKKRKI